MNRCQIIDKKIQEGYKLIYQDDNRPDGCDIWLSAWDEIKELFNSGFSKNIMDLNKKYKWTKRHKWVEDPLKDFAMSLRMELHNAGNYEPLYHHKRIIFCQELLRWCGDNKYYILQTRCDLAGTYFELGDIETGDRLFAELIRDEPDYDTAYASWFDCCISEQGGSRYEKAEEIILSAYEKVSMQWTQDILDRLIELYTVIEKPDKAQKYIDILNDIDEYERRQHRIFMQILSETKFT
jgi:tetratricopeptide (TPR) repeat protein